MQIRGREFAQLEVHDRSGCPLEDSHVPPPARVHTHVVNIGLTASIGQESHTIRQSCRGRVTYQASSGTTQRGASPRATRCTLSNALRKRATWLSQVGPAKCAVSTTLSSLNNGLLEGGGSRSKTSSPAPKIFPSESVLCSAISSITR